MCELCESKNTARYQAQRKTFCEGRQRSRDLTSRSPSRDTDLTSRSSSRDTDLTSCSTRDCSDREFARTLPGNVESPLENYSELKIVGDKLVVALTQRWVPGSRSYAVQTVNGRVVCVLSGQGIIFSKGHPPVKFETGDSYYQDDNQVVAMYFTGKEDTCLLQFHAIQYGTKGFTLREDNVSPPDSLMFKTFGGTLSRQNSAFESELSKSILKLNESLCVSDSQNEDVNEIGNVYPLIVDLYQKVERLTRLYKTDK